MEHVIAIVALVLTGPLVGVELGVAAFTNPLVAKLPDDAYRVFRSGGSRLLGALMPSWYIGTLVVLIAGAVPVAKRADDRGRRAHGGGPGVDGHRAGPNQQPDRCLAVRRGCESKARRQVGPVTRRAGGPARRDVRRTGRRRRVISARSRPLSVRQRAEIAPFWLIGGRHAILDPFHRRPSVTEKSVEGPGLPGGPRRRTRQAPA